MGEGVTRFVSPEEVERDRRKAKEITITAEEAKHVLDMTKFLEEEGYTLCIEKLELRSKILKELTMRVGK